MKSKNLWIVGLVLILIGAFINGLLIRADIGGIIRELMRLIILAGIFFFVYGLIQRAKLK